jgi:N-alpha-acetyl-L-2,4-diaminobutyrate deacetylase
MFDSAVEEAGKVFVSTELGGGGSATAESVAIADRGVRGFLVHAGAVEATAEKCEPHGTTGGTVLLDMPDSNCYTTSEHRGMLEMCRDLGEMVEAGEVIARVHDIDRTGTAPVEYFAQRRGLLAGRHFPGLVQAGDTVALIADILEDNAHLTR